MSRAEQKWFVREMSKTVAETICAFIDEGRIPEDWGGSELRVLLAEKHTQHASVSCITRNPRSSRARDYRNHCAIQNL